GMVWIGLSRGVIPLALFVDRGRFALDLAVGVGAGLLLVGVWRLAGRLLPAARDLESALARVLGAIPLSEALGLALLSGFAEELFFRGALQGAVGFPPPPPPPPLRPPPQRTGPRLPAVDRLRRPGRAPLRRPHALAGEPAGALHGPFCR